MHEPSRHRSHQGRDDDVRHQPGGHQHRGDIDLTGPLHGQKRNGHSHALFGQTRKVGTGQIRSGRREETVTTLR